MSTFSQEHSLALNNSYNRRTSTLWKKWKRDRLLTTQKLEVLFFRVFHVKIIKCSGSVEEMHCIKVSEKSWCQRSWILVISEHIFQISLTKNLVQNLWGYDNSSQAPVYSFCRSDQLEHPFSGYVLCFFEHKIIKLVRRKN